MIPIAAVNAAHSMFARPLMEGILERAWAEVIAAVPRRKIETMGVSSWLAASHYSIEHYKYSLRLN